MKKLFQRSVAKITPRPGIMYCSQGRALLSTDLSGTISGSPKEGLFYGETRILSRYQYFVNGKPPQMIAVSDVEQHSWLGYYIFPPPGAN